MDYFWKLLKKTLRLLIILTAVFCVIYILSLGFFYFKQEKFFFNGKELNKNFKFSFEHDFKELKINVGEHLYLSALHFKSKNPKGIILYLHGNAGAIHDWGKRAHLYTENNYDVLFVDYRGYGKSDGYYNDDKELFEDVQKVYDYTKTIYKESKIRVLGLSLGSGLAAYLASKNNPKSLILEAPYYSWKVLISEEIAPPIPSWIIKYDIPTYAFLENVKCPVQIFHGTRDFLINLETNSKKLKLLYPEKVTLTPIIDGAHNNIHISKQYHDALKTLLH